MLVRTSTLLVLVHKDGFATWSLALGFGNQQNISMGPSRASSALLLLAGGVAAAYIDGLFGLTPPLIPLQQHGQTADLFPMADCAGFRLEEATIDDMQRAMRDGRLSSVSLAHCYLVRTFQTQQYIKWALFYLFRPSLDALMLRGR